MTETNQNKPAERKDAGEPQIATASEARSTLYQKVVPPQKQIKRTEQTAKHRVQKPADQVIGGEPVHIEQPAQPTQPKRPRQKRTPQSAGPSPKTKAAPNM